MASDTKKDVLRAVRHRKYLNKEFDAFRGDLLEYAKTFYKERINDFSDASLGGVFLDFASYVGDVMSFYLDHQFTELNPETAVETLNIERMLKNSGVDITGASPSVVNQTFYVEIPAVKTNGVSIPMSDAICVIDDGTVVVSESGIEYILLEPVDFTEKKQNGELKCGVVVGNVDDNGVPQTFILVQSGMCVSGFQTQESFNIGSFVPFLELSLSNPDVTEIQSVYDSYGNTYFEVGSLAQDVVYRGVPNLNDDNELVKESLEVIPAPYRFTKKVNLDTRITTLKFGGGSADTMEDDVIPDPSEFALPLYGKTTFSRLSINPQQLLNTKTLGVIAPNTTLTVSYRYGGGLNHNAEPDSIRSIKTLQLRFPSNPQPSLASAIRSTIETRNIKPAVGGDDAPTIDDLKEQIAPARNSQSRIVSKSDLISRVYMMPSNFGRVFRAGVRSNPNNPLSSQLFIISRDSQSKLVIAPDALKQNLRKFLNDYRMISDAIDILDAPVINLKLQFEIIADPTLNNRLVLQQIIKKLKKYFDIKNFQIDQPIMLSDVSNIIFNTVGVISVNNFKFDSVTGNIANRQYSDVYLDVKSQTTKGLLIPQAGGIFEIRYPDIDILGRAV